MQLPLFSTGDEPVVRLIKCRPSRNILELRPGGKIYKEISEVIREGNSMEAKVEKLKKLYFDLDNDVNLNAAKEELRLPRIVCLCGSTRFSKAFQEANLRETLKGNVILTIGCDMRSDDDIFADTPKGTLEQIKDNLDLLHLNKIMLADEVLILNVGGYIGESTQRELEFAQALGKDIRFLEDGNDG